MVFSICWATSGSAADTGISSTPAISSSDLVGTSAGELGLPEPEAVPVPGPVFGSGQSPLPGFAPTRHLLALLLRRRMRDAEHRYGIRW